MTILNTALSKDSGKIPLYVTSDPGLTSIYKPNFKLLKEISTEKNFKKFTIENQILVSADKLDNQLDIKKIDHADFIKIDTEGSEVDILMGAQEILKNSVFGIESEIAFVQMRENQLTFSDLHKYLSEAGFHLFDLKNRYLKRPKGQLFGMLKGQLIYCDALFFKTIDALQTTLKQFSKEKQKLMIINAITISGVYGYFDYAHEIFRSFEDLFDSMEKTQILKAFEYSKVKLLRIPHFPGRGTLSLIFYTLALILASRIEHRNATRFGNNSIGNIDW